MKALVLAGGLGTRLRPLTYQHPKPLLPVANRPHVEHIFDRLIDQGVDEAILLTSYMSEAFDETVERASTRGLRVRVAVEIEPLGTAGAIKNGEGFIADEPFFVFNGDVLIDADLGELARLHAEREAEATILLTPVEDPSAFGVVPTGESGLVRGFIEKPPPGEAPTNHINAGVYMFEPSMLSRIPAGEVYSTEKALFPGMVSEGARLFAFTLGSYWIDIGTPANYLQANLDSLSGAYRTPEASGIDERGVLAAPGAKVSAGAGLRSVCIGNGAIVESEAEVERSVLLPGATVCTGADVRNAILGQDAVVDAGSTVNGEVVTAGERKEIG